jgi:hypothetical protein
MHSFSLVLIQMDKQIILSGITLGTTNAELFSSAATWLLIWLS